MFGIIPETTVKLLGERRLEILERILSDITARAPEEMWSFSNAFDLSDPWAQRAMRLGRTAFAHFCKV